MAESLLTLSSGSTKSNTYNAILTTSNWLEGADGRYYNNISISKVAADTPIIMVDVALSGTDLDADAAILEAWTGPSAHNVVQGAGTLTFYSYEVPAVNIPINVGVC